MKNLFCIIVTYTKPIEEIEAVLPLHREYLAKGYEAGFLLASGPQNPRVGGLILGHFENKQSAEAFTKNDPYAQHNLAKYEIIEFSPVLHAEILKDFLA
ncbi:GTP cyclohydrolase [Helicobacter sp. MIT 00-7814]|uniref:YciI family protein n=1 Tax=unclassified Helicobacter TaxID=2593540 RepID=UPI000E1E60DA|nr:MULTISPECIES: YciI family protein [unclassified Helicobacter]RDU54829.1 GTP cyclohydrolase [Helicobacter sp. MIT 99-10781]RDU54887.1 GTP cyclohydrolase [Helicobacter sp. MIT 00-7814]